MKSGPNVIDVESDQENKGDKAAINWLLCLIKEEVSCINSDGISNSSFIKVFTEDVGRLKVNLLYILRISSSGRFAIELILSTASKAKAL
jgi:hypothetical protein